MWRLVIVCVSVTLIFFVAQAVVLAGAWLAYPGEYPDLFARYEAMMPGQGVLKDLPCALQTVYATFQITECVEIPATGAFASVTSSVFSGKFNRIVFTVNDVLVGDIIRHWGQPDILVKHDSSFIVMWGDQGLYAFINPAVETARFNYMLPVASLTVGLQVTTHS